MRKRAAASRRAQISSQKRPRRKKTADGAPPPGLSSCGTQIQAPSPHLKRQRKRKTPDDVLYSSCLRPCPIADAQVILSSPSWGAKRGRTAVRKRDWAYLDDGPVGLIAERVLANANDVADYIRFRAVCLPWRRCSADTRGRGVLDDRRFHPRSWIMLVGDRKEELADRRQFLNTSTGQCIQVAIPELRDHNVLRSTAAEGLLFLQCKATAAVRLLNPLTRHMAELPPITGLGLDDDSRLPEPDTAGLADDRTVLLYFDDDGTLAFAKPGNESWVLVKTNTAHLMPTVSCAGRFYGATPDAIMTVDMTGGGEGLPPRLVVAAKMAKRMGYGSMTGGSVHLVDNGGELMLVHRTTRSIRDYATQFGVIHKTMYKVYRIDLDRGRMVPTANLRGRAVFIDDYKALSVAPQVFPFIDANTVYPGLGLDERYGRYGDPPIGAYHLRDGSTESLNNKGPSGLIRPWSIADCLAAYVEA